MKIEPRLGAGIRDYLPEDSIPRRQMFATIQRVFERFGFLPLDTPALELESILTGGDPNFKMQIFRARLREEDEKLALRFDLTVPLARVIAQYREHIRRPFKRYQVGTVWRGEKPQAGRFREFVQFDADIVGAASPAADAEIVALMYETMRALGINAFQVRVNSRKILNGLPTLAGFNPEFTVGILRIIDKLDRVGWDSVAGELVSQYQLSPTQLEKMKFFLEIRGASPNEVLTSVSEVMWESPIALEGVKELNRVCNYLEAMGIPQEFWVIDLSVARGLGYYTGPVFETILTEQPSIGSVFSGGRYDDLVARFGDVTVPATGASVGVDRLFAAMSEVDLIRQQKTITQALVLNFDHDCELDCHRLVTLIRQAEINGELYLGHKKTIKEQLAYASESGVPLVLIIGGNEKAAGLVRIKNMISREQTDVPKNDVPSYLKGVLGK